MKSFFLSLLLALVCLGSTQGFAVRPGVSVAPTSSMTETTTTALNVFRNRKSKEQQAEEEAKYWQGEWVCKDCLHIYNRAEYAGMFFEEQGPDFRCPQCSGPRRRYAKKVGDRVGTILDGGGVGVGANPNPNPSGDDAPTFWKNLQEDLKVRLGIFQESQAQGDNFKQSMANVLAGEYDSTSTRAKIDEYIQSAPCVMFTWERSPSCVQAKKTFEMMGILDQVMEVPLDKPWADGNPIRAELGKKVGRSSVPAIFIGGAYVGGFDGGLSTATSPGIQAMAFQGTLRPALEAAGIKFPSKVEDNSS